MNTAADLVVPLEQRLITTLARPRLYASLFAAFAAFALIVAAVGVFGLLSYSVSQRSRELAVRAHLVPGSATSLRSSCGMGSP